MMDRNISIETDHAALVLSVTEDGKLLQRAFGAKGGGKTAEDQPAYPASGDGWVYEPALRAIHADGNTSTDLRYVSHSTEGTTTQIELRDPAYPFSVDLFFQAFPEQDVISAWTVIRHKESGAVRLEDYASSAPAFGSEDLYLTQFRGDWNDEMHMDEERLGYGIKVLDSKIGVRAHQFRSPWFLLAKGLAQEDEGEVFGGSLAWSGSFRFAFEKLPQGPVRAVCGIHPHASAYLLKPWETFETPKMVWGWSGAGTGTLSRNLQAWVRENALREAEKPRDILLNNWEATYFTFDEAKIVSLFDGAKEIGIELFLLDDGWFGEKYPRDADTQGLGDWMPDPNKLPNGVRALVDAAQERGLRFGIWLEPEMVNPKSVLFEEHPDWAIRQPQREIEEQRNQMVLDLTRPEVKEYVFGLVDKVLTDDPGIGYVKWDCNRYLTQPGSPYLSASEQSHLTVLYTKVLYEIFERVIAAHPHVRIMMCSGGGGRVDYGAMRFAHEFWPSDNTDPVKRIFIQWGAFHFFPPISVSCHVTHAGHRPLKFAFDVAMSGRMGMDMEVDKLSDEDRAFAARAIEAYKGIRDTVQQGVQYRLESPYAGTRSALMSVRGDEAVVFVYSLGESAAAPLRLKGLDASKTYSVREVLGEFEASLTGDELMDGGLPLPAYGEFGSGVFVLA